MGTLRVAGGRGTAADQNQYYGFSDVTDTTVTAATAQNLSTPYTIAANEPAVGSSYEIKFGGTGTQGSTARSMAFTVVLQGVVLVANVNVDAGAFAANAGFRFKGVADLFCSATGALGGFRAGIMVNISEVALATGLFTAATQTIGLADANSAASTIDTTAAMTAVVKFAWGSVTGAPTITNRHTKFRKDA